MTELLPITITVDAELAKQQIKIMSVANKLEAQFNFHALTANWFGDEDNIVVIQLFLETPATFAFNKKEQDNLLKSTILTSHFSDDVVSYLNQYKRLVQCHIALTDSELEILTEQPKLLAGFLQAKCHKVLNLIAQQQALDSI